MSYPHDRRLPDHVTRYNHKPNRWMNECKPYQENASEWPYIAIIAMCVSMMITVGVMLLQGGMIP